MAKKLTGKRNYSQDFCIIVSVATPCTTHALNFYLPDAMTEKGMEAFYNEVAIMKRVSVRGHPHVITMVGYIPRGVPPAIVMEFAPLSTLLKFLMKIKDDVRAVHTNQVLNHLYCVQCSPTMQGSRESACYMMILCIGFRSIYLL